MDEIFKKENRIFVIAAVAALAVDLLFSQDAVNKISVENTVLVLGMLIIANLVAFRSGRRLLQTGRDLKQADRRLLQTGSMIVVWLLALIWSAVIVRQNYGALTGHIGAVTIGVGAVTLAVFSFIGHKHRQMTEDSILVLLMAALAMRIFYVVMTQAHIYQNDIGVLWSPLGGHLGYVRYLLDNHALPDFDPTTRHQFYQPPLHYIITALWVKLHTFFGVLVEAADENIQVLSLFYSMASLGILNKIGIRLKMSVWGRFAALSVIAFLPYDIMMSATLNNDLLMTLLVLLCIYFTIKWYQESGLVNILLMGITIGCAMMTKISGVLISPGVAIIMLVKAWNNKQQWKGYLGQFMMFGLAAFPLGLWYPLKCLFQYGVPLGYVPNMGTDSRQYIGIYTGARRILDIRNQLVELCMHWELSDPYIDYNIPVSLVKFAVFGEGSYYLLNKTVKGLGTGIFWLTAVIMMAVVGLCVVWLIKKNLSWTYKISIAVMVLVIMASYVKFCYMYPHVCTMHIRYVMVAVYLAVMAAASALDHSPDGKTDSVAWRRGRLVVSMIIFVYAVLSVLLNWNMEILLQA